MSLLKLTKGELRVLKLMEFGEAPGADEHVDGELVHEVPGGWYVDLEKISPKIGWALVRKVLVRATTAWKDNPMRYVLNEEGRAALNDPSYRPKMVDEMLKILKP